MEEQPFGNLQHTVRIGATSTFAIPRPADEQHASGKAESKTWEWK